jgi:hypothetical protein
VFGEAEETIRVFESDGIVADAAAGADYIKIRADAMFNERDVRAPGSPRRPGARRHHPQWPEPADLHLPVQGPAVVHRDPGRPGDPDGVIAFASYPSRLRKLTNRTRAIHMVEEGADFLQVFEFFREQGFEMAESYSNASRVFRGSVPTGLPFTKDLSYLKGFIMVYNYIPVGRAQGQAGAVPLLFCGKTTLEDMRTLRQLVDEGLVVPPKYLPEQFRDMNALSAWMCFSNFLNHLSLDRIEADSNIL